MKPMYRVFILFLFLACGCTKETTFKDRVVGNWKSNYVFAYDNFMNSNICFVCDFKLENNMNYSLSVRGVHEKTDSVAHAGEDFKLIGLEYGTYTIDDTNHNIFFNPIVSNKINCRNSELEQSETFTHKHHVRIDETDELHIQIQDSNLFFPNSRIALFFEIEQK